MLLMRKIRVFFGPAQAIFARVFWSVLESSHKSMLVFSPNHTITYYIHIDVFFRATEGEPQALGPLAWGSQPPVGVSQTGGGSSAVTPPPHRSETCRGQNMPRGGEGRGPVRGGRRRG